jgi:hypothetical protein
MATDIGDLVKCFAKKKLAPHLIGGGTGWREEGVSRIKYGEILQSGTQIACT